jgi:tetratricopeptide (TPR) repeat protein
MTLCPAKAGKDKQSMSKQTDKSLFIVPSMPRFYQQLLSGVESHQALGNRIIRQIKAAHAFRQVEHVKELARVLINNPIKEYRLIAQYYLVWSECRKSHYDATTLERIVEQTQTYKAKALISRAAFEVYKGNMSEALHFYTEALRTNPILPDYIKASTGIATVKSMEGFHASALRDLEHLLPLLGHADPLNYFEVTNSLAVELGEVGRLQEARNVSSLVLASPFIYAYPEWQETHAELSLKQKNHSSVTVPSLPKQQPKPKQSRLKDNVIKFPLAERLSAKSVTEESGFSIPLAPLQALGLILKAVLGRRITDEEVENICNNYYEVIMDWYS